MITGIIAVVILIAVLPPAISNGEWGVLAVAVIAAIVVLWFGAVSRQQDRAYGNMLRFWDTGELPGEQRRPERPERAGRVSRKEREEAARKREAYRQERMRQSQEWQKPKQTSAVCHYCGRFVEIPGYLSVVQTPEGTMRKYQCPKCGRLNYTKLGG